MPNGIDSKPIFNGTLATNTTAGINSSNNLGLWAVNSGGAVQELLSSAASISVGGGSQRVRTFKSLVPLQAGGVESGYNVSGVAVIFDLSGGQSALIDLALP